MKNKTFLIGMMCILSFAIIMMTGCASVPQSHVGNRVVQVFSNANANSVKISKLTETVYLGYFNPGGTSFPSIADTARAGNITKIATVEYYSRAGILWLWTDYTTIVTGQWACYEFPDIL